ncbi:MAG: hypothetical protein JW915_14725 [Chitinispirillaceae bacterium]|nr:hypothetical protein [Chitinispirillaceae bacterium]
MIKIINDHFGSKKGLFNLLKSGIYLLIGTYNTAVRIDFTNVSRFVFVCSGNICRSPLAEIVMKKAGGNAISFGLDTRGGDKADPRMIAFGKEYGFDLSMHITQQMIRYVPEKSDLLVGMEPRHLAKLHSLFPGNQITALGLWLPQKKVYIHDPFSTNMVYFKKCAQEIVLATGRLFRTSETRNV